MNNTFPHYTTNIIDGSLVSFEIKEVLPLMRAVYAMKTESSKKNVPIWCDDLIAARVLLGEGTLDPDNKTYFGRASQFLLGTLPKCGAFVIGVEADDAATATMVLELVYDSADQSMVFGTREIDVAGGETAATIAARVIDETTNIYTIPIMIFTASNTGSYANSFAFNLHHGVKYDTASSSFVNVGNMTADELQRLGTFMYDIEFARIRTGESVLTPVRTMYNSLGFNFSVESDINDPATGAGTGYAKRVKEYFNTAIQVPMEITVLEANIQRFFGILAAQATVSAGGDDTNPITTFIDEYHPIMNVFTLTTQLEVAGVDTLHDVGDDMNITITDNTGLNGGGLSELTAVYLSGGSNGNFDSDGSVDDNINIDAAIIKIWDMTTKPELQDKPRFPFNFIPDVGYTVPVKEAIAEMVYYRPDVKPVMATWDGQAPTQDIAGARAAGSAIVGNIRNFLESKLYGTDACRGIVFSQFGREKDPKVDMVLPMSYWYMCEAAKIYNGTQIKGELAGEKAYVKNFIPESLNFTPYLPTSKQLLWSTGLNYCQYYGRDRIHFGGLKGIYAHESSLLVNDSYINAVIFIMQTFDALWASYASVTGDDEIVYADVLADLGRISTHLLNGTARASFRMYQTPIEAETGIEHHLAFTLTDSKGQRIWHIDLIANEA